MRFTYDKDSDAVYIKFKTVEEANGFSELTQGEWPINVDITKEGVLIGIEFMNARSIFSQDFLDKAEMIKIES